MSSQTSAYSSIFSFLSSQDAAALAELYGSRWCAVAVLQSLPSHARTVLLRLAAIRVRVSEPFVLSWFRPTASRHNERAAQAALETLRRLSLVGCPPGRGPTLTLNGVEELEGGLGINLGFAASLQEAWASADEVPWQRATREAAAVAAAAAAPSSAAAGSVAGADVQRRAAPTAAAIERYASSRWNVILHFLVDLTGASSPDPRVADLLLSTGLIREGAGIDPNTGEVIDDDDVDADTRRRPQGAEDKRDAGTEADGGPDKAAVDGEWLPPGLSASSAPRHSSKRPRPSDDSAPASAPQTRAHIAAAQHAAETGSGEENKAASDGGGGGGDYGATGNGDGGDAVDVRGARRIRASITKAGYEFLLKDTSVQLWTFLSEYIRTAEVRSMRTVDILVFLFELSFCRAGEGCSVSALTDTQRRLLEDFASFGLVYVPDGGGDAGGGSDSALLFYPTSLSVILTQPDSASATMSDVFRLSPGRDAPPGGADAAVAGSIGGEQGAEGGGALAAGPDAGTGLGAARFLAAQQSAAVTSDSKLTLIVEKNLFVAFPRLRFPLLMGIAAVLQLL